MIKSLYIWFCHVVWRHVTWCDVMPRGVTSCHVVWRHVTWCDVMSRGVTSCHVVDASRDVTLLWFLFWLTIQCILPDDHVGCYNRSLLNTLQDVWRLSSSNLIPRHSHVELLNQNIDYLYVLSTYWFLKWHPFISTRL